MTRYVIPVLLLTLLYALVLSSFAWLDLLTGAVLAAVLLLLFRRSLFEEQPVPVGPLPKRLLASVPLALAVLREIAAGTWTSALISLRLRPLTRAGFVAVPIGDRTVQGVTVSALVTMLSPGTVLVDVDWAGRFMLYHLLDASDPDGFRAAQETFYRRYQRRVFP